MAVAVLLCSGELFAQDVRPLSLEEAIALATSTSESAAVARAGVNRAEANVDRAESQGKPQINASASYQRQLKSQFEDFSGGGSQPETPPGCTEPYVPNPDLPLEERVSILEQRVACPGGSPLGGIDFSQLGFGAPNTWTAGFSFNWPFFTGGRVAAQTRAAEAVREIAEESEAADDAQTRLDVTTAYFDAQLAAQLVDIGEASLALAEETLRITSLRAREGAQAEFDVLQARVSRDNQRPVLIRRQTTRDLAFDRLRALTDIPRDQTLRLITPPTAGIDSDVDLTPDIASRTPVRQAQLRLDAANEQLEAARAQTRPTISAQSQYGLVAYSDSILPDLGSFRKNWTVGASIQLPLYAGGRITADIDAARADVQEAEAQLEQVTEFAQLDADSAVAEVRAARAAHAATEGTVEQARRGYDLARLRYQEGVSIPLEVQNARFLLEQAELNRAQAARDLRVALTRLELLPRLPLGAAQQPPSQSQQEQQAAPQPQQQNFSMTPMQRF